MTLHRAPVTFERALATIAGELGWDGCADVLGKSESHVRKLGAPDTEREISLRDAMRLDQAWRRSGRQGAPLLECYALKMDIALPGASAPEPGHIAHGAGIAAKETGEAVAAAIEMAADLSNPKVRRRALKETEEGISALTRLLAQIYAAENEENRA